MGWKNLPYWLRGGIILLVLSVFLLYFLSTTVLCVDPSSGADLSNPIFGCKSELERLFINLGFTKFIGSIFFLGVSFLIGAIIGLIIGKIKSKSKKQMEDK